MYIMNAHWYHTGRQCSAVSFLAAGACRMRDSWLMVACLHICLLQFGVSELPVVTTSIKEPAEDCSCYARDGDTLWVDYKGFLPNGAPATLTERSALQHLHLAGTEFGSSFTTGADGQVSSTPYGPFVLGEGQVKTQFP